MIREGELEAAMDLYTAIGLGGVGFYVASYGLVQVGRMDGNGAPYSAMNVIAAAMVFVSLLQDFNLASMVTQITWIAIGVGGLLLRFHRNRRGAVDGAETTHATDGTVSDPDPAVDVVVPFPQNGASSVQGNNATIVRVRPVAASGNVTPRPTLNLRPDTAPARTGRRTLGIQADLAPVT